PPRSPPFPSTTPFRSLLGVRAGPPPAPSDVLDRAPIEVAPLGDLCREVVVDAVQHRVHALPLAVAELAVRREHQRVLTAGDRTLRDPEAVGQLGGDDLPAQNADRSGEGGRLRDDDVGAHRHEVAAGRGDPAHGYHHRLTAAAGEYDMAPYDVGADVRAARAVDPEDYGLHPVVVDRRAEGGADRLGPGGRAERAARAATETDHPDGVDERDRIRAAAGGGPPGDTAGEAALVASHVLQPSLLTDSAANLVVD